MLPKPTPEIIKKIHESRKIKVRIPRTDSCIFCRKRDIDCRCDSLLNEDPYKKEYE